MTTPSRPSPRRHSTAAPVPPPRRPARPAAAAAVHRGKRSPSAPARPSPAARRPPHNKLQLPWSAAPRPAAARYGRRAARRGGSSPGRERRPRGDSHQPKTEFKNLRATSLTAPNGVPGRCSAFLRSSDRSSCASAGLEVTPRGLCGSRLRERIHPEGPGPAPRVGLCGPRQGQQGQVMSEEQR